jgi:hypothetical protein
MPLPKGLVRASDFVGKRPELRETQMNNTGASWADLIEVRESDPDDDETTYPDVYVDPDDVDERGWCDTIYVRFVMPRDVISALRCAKDLMDTFGPDEVTWIFDPEDTAHGWIEVWYD